MTVVFLTLAVLAQGGGEGISITSMRPPYPWYDHPQHFPEYSSVRSSVLLNASITSVIVTFRGMTTFCCRRATGVDLLFPFFFPWLIVKLICKGRVL